MIGRIITVSTIPALRTLIPMVDGGPNSGMNPSALYRPGSMRSTNGTSTTSPQKP